MCQDKHYDWENSPVNFDHIFNSYFSLVEVASFKGWIHLIIDAIDSRVSQYSKRMCISISLLNRCLESLPLKKAAELSHIGRQKFRMEMHLKCFNVLC